MVEQKVGMLVGSLVEMMADWTVVRKAGRRVEW
jgi:hypothetical protein